MLRRFGTNYAIISIALDFGFTLLALVLAVQIRLELTTLPGLVPVKRIEFLDYPRFITFVVPTLWVLIFFLASVYDPRRNYKAVDELLAVVLAIGLSSLVFSGILYLFVRNFSRYLLLTFVILDIIFLVVWRLFARFIRRTQRRAISETRLLIIGAGEVGQQVGSMIQDSSWNRLNLVGYLDDDPEKRNEDTVILGNLNSVRSIVQKYMIDDVVIALPQRAYGKVNKLTFELHDLPVHIRVVPDYFSLALYKASVDDFGGVPMINLRDPALNEVQRLMKRVFDLFIGGVTIVTLSPFMAIVAVLIRLDSPGSVLFKQKRIGENGRVFTMYKYRSMIAGAEDLQDQYNEIREDGTLLFKKKADDPRITRVGRIIRRTSVDELPQLLNVLKGDMSLVGPRPELPWLVERYKPWQRKRFAVPQGITGWWQINGRSDKPMHLNTEDDLYYVQNYSIWLDMYILLKTFLVVLRGNGAY